jgi:hypothetical protein
MILKQPEVGNEEYGIMLTPAPQKSGLVVGGVNNEVSPRRAGLVTAG